MKIRNYCLSILAVAALAPAAYSQFYVRGTFNDWQGTSAELVSTNGGPLTYTVTGLAPGSVHEFKVTVADWSLNWPGDNVRAMANAAGEITVFAFDQETWTDGWMPANNRRVGYSDSGLHGWDVAGTMNDWSGGAAWTLADLGNGLYEGVFLLPAGNHEFKFRKAGDWDIAIGFDFRNSGGNIGLSVPEESPYIFQLDLQNGRWDVSVIPEPSTYALLFGLGVMGLVLYRRRRMR